MISWRAVPLAVAAQHAPKPLPQGQRPQTLSVPDSQAAWGRRQTLGGVVAASVLLGFRVSRAEASPQVRSLASLEPCTVTFKNEHDRVVRVLWINYSGDAELFASIPPAGWWSVDTFESHPWRVEDAETGEVLQEVVATKGESLVSVGPTTAGGRLLSASSTAAPEFEGWDGVGGSADEYVLAAIDEIGLDHLGGVAILSADGFTLPIPIAVGMADAAQLFHTAAPQFRRPSTMALWARSLQAAGATVDRVLITRLVGSTVYARVILLVPGGELRSLDARPADSLALAMQTGAPIYMGRRLAASQQPGALEAEAGDWNGLRPPKPSSQGPSPPMTAQASYAHTRKA